MNELPDNVLIKIFGFFNLKDLTSLRDVCTRFRQICESEIKIEELVVSSRIEDRIGLWSFGDRPIYYKDAISVRAMFIDIELFNLKQHLKCLHIRNFTGDSDLQFDFDVLTGFVQLQQLDVDAFLAARKGEKVIICSQSLRVMSTVPQNSFVLETPNLAIFKCKYLNDMHFVYPAMLKVVEVSDYQQKCSDFKNLECLVLEHGGALDPDLLMTFEQLKELKVHAGNTIRFVRFRETMNFIFKAKLVLRRLDFRVFIHGVLVNDLNQFVGEFDNDRPLDYQMGCYMRNADLLSRNLSYYTSFNWSDLMSIFDHQIPDDFTVRFFNIRSVTVSGGIKDEHHLIGFLKHVNLESLYLKQSDPSQNFFAQLTACHRLIKLKIEDSIDLRLNYEFLLRFKLLEDFSTDQYCPDLMRVAALAFRDLKYVRVFQNTHAQLQFQIAPASKSKKKEFSIELILTKVCKDQNRLFWRKTALDDLVRLTDVLASMIAKDKACELYSLNFNYQ